MKTKQIYLMSSPDLPSLNKKIISGQIVLSSFRAKLSASEMTKIM